MSDSQQDGATQKTGLMRHSFIGRMLHWVTGGLVLYGYAKGLRNVSQLNDPALLHFEMMFAFGLGAALILRFIWMKKFNNGSTRIPKNSSKFQKIMVSLGHNAIYVTLGGIIISGILIGFIFTSSLSGSLLQDAMVGLHNLFVFLAGGLMIGHVVIALYHKYWLKDGIMETMLHLRLPFSGKETK